MYPPILDETAYPPGVHLHHTVSFRRNGFLKPYIFSDRQDHFRKLHAARYSWNSNQLRAGIGMLYCIIERSRTHYYVTAAIKGYSKAVQASRSRSVKVFSINIIMRTMTRTLKTIAVIAERNCTAQVNTTLIERNPVGAIAIFDKVLRG
jgi:hypothetical protein